MKQRFSTSNTSPSRLEFVSSGQKSRKLAGRAFFVKMSRMSLPS